MRWHFKAPGTSRLTASPTKQPAPGAFSTARALTIALGLAAAVAVLDQLSKWAVLDYFATQPHAVAVTGYFNLTLAYNTGISFGIFRDGADWMRWVLILAAFGIMAFLLAWLRREPGKLLSLAIGLVCGGALGNVIDRIRVGAVVDFMDFYLGAWHWPAFNLADSAIVAGVLGLVLDGLFQSPSSSKE